VNRPPAKRPPIWIGLTKNAKIAEATRRIGYMHVPDNPNHPRIIA